MKPAGPVLAALLLLCVVFGANPAAAQSTQPLRLQPGEPLPLQAPSPLPAEPFSPQAAPQTGRIDLRAFFSVSNQQILSGLAWRIYEDRDGESEPVLVAKAEEAAPSLSLPPGNYIVHAAYGFTSAIRRVTMQWGNVEESVVIRAGALMLRGTVGESPIPVNQIAFSVYVPIGNDPEGRLVVSNARANEIIRLPEGTYHVVSTYGDANAIMRSDLKVEAGVVTVATLNHRAANVTLKLVAAPGGESFAGTAFSVLTPGGDVVREAIGAFPSVTLAEGEYVLIARHDGQVYTREFTIESGLDRDIEVLAQVP